MRLGFDMIDEKDVESYWILSETSAETICS